MAHAFSITFRSGLVGRPLELLLKLGDNPRHHTEIQYDSAKWSLGNFDFTCDMLRHPAGTTSHHRLQTAWWSGCCRCPGFTFHRLSDLTMCVLRGFISVRLDCGVHFQTANVIVDINRWSEITYAATTEKIEKMAVWFFGCYKEWAAISRSEELRY